jgi:hypothetical protein
MSVGSRRAYVERLVVVRRRRSRDAELNISVGDRTVGCQARANFSLTRSSTRTAFEVQTLNKRSSVPETNHEESERSSHLFHLLYRHQSIWHSILKNPLMPHVGDELTFMECLTQLPPANCASCE